MKDEIYADSISVGCGRFTVCTNQRRARRVIWLSGEGERFKSLEGLEDKDLFDLYQALSEYLHMMSLV